MFRIGDFSRLTRVPVKTLRYYDEMGLLPPASVDRFTDYRYYSAEQFGRLNRILALRDLGLSLAQIKRVMQGAVSADQLRGMLMLRQAELAEQIEAAQDQQTRVEARLRMIDLEETMTTLDVVMKTVEPMWVASVEETVPSYDNISPVFDRLFGRLFGYVMRVAKPSGPTIALYRDDGSMKDFAIEALVPLAGKIPEADGVRVYQLAGASVASTLHHGKYDTLGNTYSEFGKWIEANGYRVAGYPREVYLSMDRERPDTWVTEIQFPVVKA